jgi:phage terminase large subunit
MEINQKHLERLAQTAKEFGCPPDQIENLLSGGYVPQPKQLEFHALARECDEPDGPTEVAQAGARGGAKSHAATAQVVFDDCQRVPGLKWLFLRKVGKSARESFEDLLSKLGLMGHYVPSRSVLELSNSSRVLLGGFRTSGEIDRYLGIEYDGILIDDAHLIDADKHKKIRGSLRTSKQNWRPRAYLTFNPGGVGHAYLKKTIVDPWRAGKLNGTRMVFSLPTDNAMINPEYLAYLDGLDGWLYRAWRKGDFDVAAGQFFTSWDYDLHVIEPFPVPANWDVWLALDYGMSHNNAIYVLAEGDGVIYIVGELVERQWLVPQHAQALGALLDRLNIARWRLKVFVAGADVFIKRAQEKESVSIADQWLAQGWKLTAAAQDRINGAGQVRLRLGNPDAGIRPTVQIFNTCARLIECIPSLEHDPNRPEDVLKVDCDPDDGSGGDDPYDAVRYGLMHKFNRYGPAKSTRYLR